MSRTKYTGPSDGLLLCNGGYTNWVMVADLPLCLVKYADINAEAIR